MPWSTRFDEPVPLPRGRRLVTLEDAGNYVTKLPKAEHTAPEWQAAMDALILVATSDGPTRFARIGVMRALNGHVERVFNPNRKDHHWGRRKLARNPVRLPSGRGFLAFLIISARPSELTRNSSRQTQWEALGGVLATAAWQRSIARSKKIATAAWWLQPQSEQQPRWSFASWPCHFLAEIALGASKDLLKSLAALPLLICAPKLNGRRYGAISASGKRLRL